MLQHRKNYREKKLSYFIVKHSNDKLINESERLGKRAGIVQKLKKKYKKYFIFKIHCSNGDIMGISITKISQNGQIVIPADIRKEMKLKKSEKFLVINEGDNIILRRLREENIKKELAALLKYFEMEFDKAGIKPEDILKEIKEHRKEKRKNHAGSS